MPSEGDHLEYSTSDVLSWFNVEEAFWQLLGAWDSPKECSCQRLVNRNARFFMNGNCTHSTHLFCSPLWIFVTAALSELDVTATGYLGYDSKHVSTWHVLKQCLQAWQSKRKTSEPPLKVPLFWCLKMFVGGWSIPIKHERFGCPPKATGAPS